jgi:hypothetical protein
MYTLKQKQKNEIAKLVKSHYKKGLSFEIEVGQRYCRKLESHNGKPTYNSLLWGWDSDEDTDDLLSTIELQNLIYIEEYILNLKHKPFIELDLYVHVFNDDTAEMNNHTCKIYLDGSVEVTRPMQGSEFEKREKQDPNILASN